MPLSEHQQKGFDELIRLLRKGEKRIIIQGLAGTGKTYLASEAIKFCNRDRTINTNYNNGITYATAPTNKALSVLQKKIDSRVEFKTIHSALRLQAYRNAAGIQTFRKAKFVPRDQPDFNKAKICFIDECSMLGVDFIGGMKQGKEIEGYLEDLRFPIIFLGDNNQINPVGELDSPVFNQNWPTIELTEIVRQGAGNPIIELSRDIDRIYFKHPKVVDGKGYLYSDNRPFIIDNLAEANGCDDFKYLAYTNPEVDLMNVLVRERRYGVPKKIEQEETLVFDAPHGGHYTNEEVKVEEVSIVTDNVAVPNLDTKFGGNSEAMNGVDYIKMKYYRINNSFNIIHEHSESVFKTICLTLKDNHHKFGWDGRAEYFFKEQFAQTKYNHAITVHKSQGSTYKETAINIGNINFNRNAVERQRLLYTAITRASDLVILNNVK